MNDFLQSIKAGDRVWVTGQGLKRRIVAIVRATPTRLSTDHFGACFRRLDGYAVSRYSSLSIVKLATPAECAEWDAQQAAKRRAEERRDAAARSRELERQRLSALFPENAWATDGEKGTWEVHATKLTTAEVEALAAKLKGEENG